LFPDDFEESEMGLLPKGWGVKTIREVIEVRGGNTPSTAVPEYWEGDIAWATPKDLSTLENPVLLTTERKITEEGLRQISSGLLPQGTVLLSSRAPIGYLAIAEDPVAVNQGFVAMICNGPVSNLFMYHWAVANMETIKAHANGSTFLEISKGTFKDLPIAVPPKKVVSAFDRAIAPLRALVVNNARQSRTLAAIRDTLLPKLISGEIRIKDAEKIVGEAV
ncbi:type I restriction-modification system restriction subunit, partial [mine drainage metagenome]